MNDIAQTKIANENSGAHTKRPDRSLAKSRPQTKALGHWSRLALHSTALVPFFLLSAPAFASCSTNNGTTKCTKDPFPYVEEVNGGKSDIRSWFFYDLTTAPSQGDQTAVINIYSTGSHGSNTGDNGKQGRPLDVYYSGGSYTMNSSQFSIRINSQGGSGHDGKDRTGGTGVTGGTGGAGGVGGHLYFKWESGAINAGEVMEVISRGGDGGEGGKGNAEDGGNAHGDVGGDAGVGGDVYVDLATDTAINYAGGPTRIWSVGGDGQKGGPAEAWLGTATGKRGGHGGFGGTVTLRFYNDFHYTQGNGQAEDGGFDVRSEGGDGGHGGGAGGSLGDSSAGNGASGGNGGAVYILSMNDAPVTFDFSKGYASTIYALSKGGDGGKGGTANSDWGEAKGGDGGAGGAGGNITINLTIGEAGLINRWNQTQGIFAQSIGGIGGDGGSGSTGLGSGKGGGGALAGNGGAVEILLYGSFIQTEQEESNAIIAQSIGGFGGDGGSGSGFFAYGADGESGGSGGPTRVAIGVGFDILTKGDSSSGIVVQSVGGGGGRGGSSTGLVSMGGFGASGGDGGAVSANTDNNSSITTFGESSFGIEVQSIGGGGGSAGSSKGLISMGGSAGSGGNGLKVSITNTATISTSGHYADAIIGQSIGGGGGSAHSTSGMVAIGGSGGDGGNGGIIDFFSYTSNINTSGTDADGIVLQSIGGGGGSGSNAFASGVQFSSAIGGQGGSGGNGASINFWDYQAGTIYTKGDRSTGLLMQSIGGGGGDGG